MTRVRVRKGDVYECTTGGKKFWIQYLGMIDDEHPGIRVFSDPSLALGSMVRQMSFVGLGAAVGKGKWKKISTGTEVLPLSEAYLWCEFDQDEGGPFVRGWQFHERGTVTKLAAELPEAYSDYPTTMVQTWSAVEKELLEGSNSILGKSVMQTIKATRENWAEISAGFNAEAAKRGNK